MTEVYSTRWVHASALDQYHKVECEVDDHQKISRLYLITQSALNHLRSVLVKGISAGFIEKEYGREITPLHIDKDINHAVIVAGGIQKFIKALEKSIYTPAIEEKEIPFNEKVIELRLKACVESLIVKEINARNENSLSKDRVNASYEDTKGISSKAQEIILFEEND